MRQQLDHQTPTNPEHTRPRCVLLFSGGRDSTLSAVRLSAHYHLILVILTAEHLLGLDRVAERLHELRRYLPDDTEFILAQPIVNALSGLSGCFPCQGAATIAAVQVARDFRATVIAFGYSGYQKAWLEQSPEAVSILRRSLHEAGFSLELPVYNIEEKDGVIRALKELKLSPDSLEQKCIRQQHNPDQVDINQELERWRFMLTAALRADSAAVLFRPWTTEIVQ